MSEFLIPVDIVDSLPDLPWKDKLAYLVHRFSQMPPVECPLIHEFEGDTYIRKIGIPKGTFFVGRIHKIGHQVDLLSGSVIHVREKCRRIVHAPFTLKTSPGDQVCAIALTDITARTVHLAQECRDTGVLEERYFETAQSLADRGAIVAETLRNRLYERDSGSGRSSGGGWSGRHHLCVI